jgi:WD40 repeat protein
MSKFKERLGKQSPKKRLYTLETLPGHLAQSVQGERLHRLLTDFDFIEAKLDALGVQALIEDYDLARISEVLLSEGQTETLRLIQGAIRKSAQALDNDKTQLVEHLWGRLVDFERPQIQGLLEQGKQSKDSPWLRPLKANLEWPGEGCLRTLSGHTDSVFAVAIAPDGVKAISASWDKTLKIWDTETGTEVRTLTGHTDSVYAVDLAPDGKTAISASRDNTLKIWDLFSGKEVASFSGDAEFYCCTIAPDGVTVVAGDASGRVHFLRLEGMGDLGDV